MALIDLEIDVTFNEVSIRSLLNIDNSYTNYDSNNVAELVSKSLKHIISRILPVAAKVHGFWAELYFPRKNRQSVYGHYSDDQGYPTTYDEKIRVVATGIVVDRMFSGDNVDNYFGPPPTLYLIGDKSDLPENTKIRVLFGSERYIEYQLDHCDVVHSFDSILITKLILLPVSGQH